ncbi:MAG TPA: acyl-CoA dehydrogenase family protein [Pseudonocardia sp.]
MAPLDGDFFGFQALLPDADLELLAWVRAFLDREVRPVVTDHWTRAEFPFELVPGFAELDIAGLRYGLSEHQGNELLNGFLALELCRVDASDNSFHGVHAGLAMGSIHRCGSDEQRERWLPPMARMEQLGAFALTEEDGGSDVAGGMRTTGGGSWVLDGVKRWIGNGTFADLVVVWARDVADDQVKAFVVERGTPGLGSRKMEGKIALRITQNAVIELRGCRVPEANRLPGARSFRDTARVLRQTRGGAAWGAVGCMLAAYELAVRYAADREQFGRPIGGFQLVQDHLATMLGNVTSGLAMVVRLAQLQEQGVRRHEQSALAKSVATTRMRETVALAREVFGGNGILLENDVARFFADAEALYSYEGSREMNQLIVGRSITGLSAFT